MRWVPDIMILIVGLRRLLSPSFTNDLTGTQIIAEVTSGCTEQDFIKSFEMLALIYSIYLAYLVVFGGPQSVLTAHIYVTETFPSH